VSLELRSLVVIAGHNLDDHATRAVALADLSIYEAS
jgi:hypothetical protein